MAGVHPVVSTLRSRASLRPLASASRWPVGTHERHTEDRQVSRGRLVYTVRVLDDPSEKCWTTRVDVITANGHPSMLTQNYVPAYASNMAGVHVVVSRLLSRASLRPLASARRWAEGTTARHTQGRKARSIGGVDANSDDQRTHADGMVHSHSAQTRFMWNL
jgi:hypothetical protein